MRKFITASLVCLFFWLVCVSVLADGGYFVRVTSPVEDPTMPSQQAIIVYEDNVETLIVGSEYSGNPEEFAWVLPVPAEPSEINVVPAEVFEEIKNYTQPRITLMYERESARREFGFGCAMGEDSGESVEKTPPVRILQQLQVGNYDVTVVSATDPGALIQWLTDNNFYWPDTPQANAIVDYYVSLSWCFICTKITPSVSLSDVTGSMPLKVVFSSAKIIYPMKITRLSATPEMDLTLYILTDHRVECAELSTADLDIYNALRNVTSVNVTYDEIIHPAARQGFVVEYAEFIAAYDVRNLPNLQAIINESYFITRMTTVMTPEEIENDFTFNFVPDRRLTIRVNWWLNTSAAPSGGAPYNELLSALLLFGALLLFVRIARILNCVKAPLETSRLRAGTDIACKNL